jgi:glycosyltransferase involved in cell wall biosynthesis
LAQRIPDLVVLEIAEDESVYPWWKGKHELLGVRRELLFHDRLENVSQAQIIQAASVFLEREKPDVLIGAGYADPAARFVARWVKRHGGKTILPAVGWAGDRRRWAIKEWAKGWIARRLYDAVCASGERGQAYFFSLGFSRQQVWKMFNAIDNEHFAGGAERARQNAAALRRELGLPENYFLFLGGLYPWKNVSFLLDCYARYRQSGGRWGLVAVGTGPESKSLEAKAEQEQIPDVVFAGMKGHLETPAYYGLAACLVLPSLSETWGLVINEAEAAGLPILASDKCGCVPELVHRGINGYVFDPHDHDELVRLMHRMSDGSLDLDAMRQSSRQIIAYYTPERWADALADCIRYLERDHNR